MRSMTKSAVRVARAALAVGRRTFPVYGSRTSRHDFTQAQLFALLTLWQFLRTDYRGLVTLVAEWGEPRRALGLRKVPHTTPPWPTPHAVFCRRPKKGWSSTTLRWSSSNEPGRSA